MVFVRKHRPDVFEQGTGEIEPGVRQYLGVTPGRFTNWKSRGISQEGALLAQKKLGCSANWVLSGVGNQAATLDDLLSQPTEDSPSIAEAIHALASALEGAGEMQRHTAADLLAGFATKPETAEFVAKALAAVLEPGRSETR